MSTPISSLEVTVSAVSLAGPAPNPVFPNEPSPAESARLLAVNDWAAGARYALIVNLGFEGDHSAYITNYDCVAFCPSNGSFVSGLDTTPFLWNGMRNLFTGAFYSIQLHDNGASFFAGGQLKIEKDYDNNHLNFYTPAGTIVVPLDLVNVATTSLLDINPLQSGIGHLLLRTDDDTISCSETAKWSDFWFRKNGVKLTGAMMTSADPGTWDGWINGNPFLGGTDIPTDNAQETSHYRSRFVYTATTPADNRESSEYRRWQYPNHPSAPGAVAVTLREHGPIFASYISTGGASLDTVSLKRTYDNGVTWVNSDIAIAGSGTNDSPNLAWNGQRLDAVWHNSASGLLQSSSLDLGATWSTPVSLSITGTNPKFLVDRKHGLQYYFYLDASFNLQLVRSADYGATFIDGTPLLVAAAIGAQTVAAEFASDGSLLVGYALSGVWTQRRSTDLGVSWF